MKICNKCGIEKPESDFYATKKINKMEEKLYYLLKNYKKAFDIDEQKFITLERKIKIDKIGK